MSFSDDTGTINNQGGHSGSSVGGTIISLILIILYCVGLWKVFEKAGKKGWAALIPIYNLIVVLQIAEKPIWWILLYLIPIVNFIIPIIVTWSLGTRFDKSLLFKLGLLFFPFIFFIILGFGDSQYTPTINETYIPTKV